MIMESGKYDISILKKEKNFKVFRHQVLEKIIQESILLNEAGKLEIDVSNRELQQTEKLQAGGLDPKEHLKGLEHTGMTPKKWHRAQRNRLIIEKLVQKEVTDHVPISKKSVAEYYRGHISEFRQPTQFRARQIIVDSREPADEIVAKLKSGADFAELARKYSLSPDSKRGGDLGYFDAGAYPEIFSEICQRLNIGETSEVTATDYGYQIFQLLDRREPRQRTLEEAKPAIRQILAEEKGQAAFEEWFAILRKKSNVLIDEQKLAEVNLDEKKK